MKSIYKSIMISGLIIVSPVLILAATLSIYVTYKIPFNNYYLMTMQNDCRRQIKLFHPTQSTLIAEVAKVGNWTDGTKCQFIVGELRSSPLSKEELEKIYPYDFFTAGVHFIDDDIFTKSPYNEWKEKYLKNYKLKENKNIYLVWIADENKSSDGDIRCD